MAKYILIDDVRARGMMIWGSPGGGKSVLAGQVIVWNDYTRGKACFVIDPLGTITDYFLSRGATERVIYVDMSAKEYCVPFPLYWRFGGESLFDMAQRFPEVIRLSDPSMMVAPVQGYNPFLEIATNIGMILYALNLPITATPLLMKNPEMFKSQLQEVVTSFPELSQAIDFLRTEARNANKQMFRIKLLPFLNDQSLQAICCSPTPGLDWQMIEQGYTVLLDFRHVTNEQKRSFLTLWTLKTFLTYIRSRGPGASITLVIDELKALFLEPTSDKGDSAVAKELIQLLDVYARNYNVWPVLLTQDPLSFGPQVTQSLLGIGTQIVGSMHNTDAATLLASHLFRHNPGQYSTLDKDTYRAGLQFKELAPFHFFVRPATKSGVSQRLYPMTIENLVHWTSKETIEETRKSLEKRSGVLTEQLLSVITSRVARLTIPDAQPKRDTLKRNEPHPLPAKTKENDDIY